MSTIAEKETGHTRARLGSVCCLTLLSSTIVEGKRRADMGAQEWCGAARLSPPLHLESL